MNLPVINRIAPRTIARSKLRTGLTTLGIAIGVAAVVSTAGIGESTANRVHAAIENKGVTWFDDILCSAVTRASACSSATTRP